MQNNKNICPVCGSLSYVSVPVPFDYHFGRNGGKTFEYRFCPRCCAYFCETMREWTPEKYANEIYNSDYGKTDREFDGTRSRNLAPVLIQELNTHASRRILDYGGGEGHLADILRLSGYEAYSFDPFGRKDLESPDSQKFHCIFAVEVLEHEFDANKLWDRVSRMLEPDGVFICTAEFHPGNDVSGWFYANPRAGHVLLYSKLTICYLASRHGLDYLYDIQRNIHVLKKKPDCSA